jgi:catechol 2,3-dioxygenase-like lactoylglutathione lyase family enzyme
MKKPVNIKVLFIAGFGPITKDQKASRELYVDRLGISFEEMEDGYLHTTEMEGAKYFALWPLSQAAVSCFGTDIWPEDIPIPQAWLELEVEDVEITTEELGKLGYKLLTAAHKEPWGQTVTRFLSPEGILLGIVCTPWMHQKSQ